MRTLVDIPDSLLEEVDDVARREKLSRAEAVRRAIREYVAQRRGGRADAAFGIWKSRQVDGLDYENSVRGEWDR
jgi:metal-responsive CopG/Arc/MetJ family transcriptional regulator